MTREEQLMKFWHETYLRPRSMALHLFPAKPAGFVRATQDLGNFASNASVARKARLEGKIQTASEYERIADGIYNRLPSYAKDVADAIDGGEIPTLPGRARRNPRKSKHGVSSGFGVLPREGRFGYAITGEPKTVRYAATQQHAETEARELALAYGREARVWETATNVVVAWISGKSGYVRHNEPARSNPRGVRSIKPYSVWELRRRSFPGEETRVYVTQITNGHVFFAKYFSDARGNMPEESFRRQYKPAYKSKE